MNKDGRHLHATAVGHWQLAYADCPCWLLGGYSFALTASPHA